MDARAYHADGRELVGATGVLIAVFLAFVAPNAVESVIVDVHGMCRRPVVGTTATNEIMDI